jgi:S1-C subfamily serine protease
MLARLGFCICPLISIVGTVAVHATDIPALVQRAKPAVVEILTFDQQNDLLKSGTGFFISPDGILLTNYHVISGGSGIIAKTPTGAVYILKSVVSYSEAHDVAELQFLTTDAPYLTLGHSSGAVEGQRVLVIGNPVGLEGTVSEGIISAFRAGRTLIQITAPISPGSSGSPVLDESGQVIGMAILVYREGQNLNFAISSETIRDAITKSAVVTPTPSVSAATPAPIGSVVATATPPVTEMAARAKWPDGRKLIHPDQFVIVPVVNVNTDDTLSLRAAPGTKSKVLTEIPPNAKDIIAFNYDQVWDDDTYWVMVEWHGKLGYVGRSYLPKP